jgi:hypothetical protein
MGLSILDFGGATPRSPQHLALDNDFPAPTMVIVSISIASGGGRHREGSGYPARVPLAGYAELRAPMIFLIANMGYKIPPNPLKTHSDFFSNRQFFRVSRFLLPSLEYGKTEPPRLRECAKIGSFPLQERLFLA